MSDSFVNLWTVAHQMPLSMEFPKQEYWSGLPFPSPGDLRNPGIKPRFPALQVNSSPAEPPGKPKNTGVGNLCLLQRIFPTQESNQGHLHGRRILYQLSYQGSPGISGIRKVSHPYNRLIFLIFPQGFQLTCETTFLLFPYLDF